MQIAVDRKNVKCAHLIDSQKFFDFCVFSVFIQISDRRADWRRRRRLRSEALHHYIIALEKFTCSDFIRTSSHAYPSAIGKVEVHISSARLVKAMIGGFFFCFSFFVHLRLVSSVFVLLLTEMLAHHCCASSSWPIISSIRRHLSPGPLSSINISMSISSFWILFRH